MDTPTPHLWEIEHPYYCNLGNYFTAESVGSHFDSWESFFSEFGDADKDYNLVFRFDWDGCDENDEPIPDGGVLKIFFMGQRKGKYYYATVRVKHTDEPAIIAYLDSAWQHMQRLWAPISGVTR